MSKTHPAVVCTTFGPYQDVLQIQQIADRNINEGEIRVKVLSCGLAFPDVLTLEGKHMFKPQTPYVPGSEVCGEIIEIGEGVDAAEFRLKDKVFGMTSTGGLQGETILLANKCYKLPTGVDVNVAGGFELNYGTTYHGLVDLAHLTEGETVLILGASGGIGMAAIDIAKAHGCTVVACASTAEKLMACEEAGADLCLNYSVPSTETSPAKHFKQLLRDSEVYGEIDIVFDPIGGKLSEVAMRALGWGGRFIVIGFASGGAQPKTAIPRFPINLALLNERQIIGCFWGAWYV